MKIIPIGGIGEIGMNMILINSGGSSIVVDCGVLFPPFQHLGVDTVVADYKEFCDTFKNARTLFITHGHEDHVGGIPYLIQHCKPKIYATAYASEVIKARCRSVLGKDFKIDIKVVKFGDKIKTGNFEIEYIEVDHSIPDSSALFIRTPEGNIFYVADFRLSGKNKQSFLNRIREIKNETSVDILLSDSTNAHEAADALSEEDVLSSLDSYFKRAKKKIIVTLFSSNISRINQIIKLSKKYGKNLFISGTNLKIHLGIAKSLGYMEPDNGCIRPDSEISKTAEEKIVLICTGSQAEKYSSIVRLSHGTHNLKVNKDDLVIFSSSQIPGNEKVIMDTINRLSEKGAEIVYSDDYGVHCSGHANRKELREVLHNIRPKYFIPMHGEHIHLKYHIGLAVEEGVPEQNCFVLKNGDEFNYDGDRAKIKNHHKFSRYYIDSVTGEPIDDVIIKEREIAAEMGLIIASLVVDRMGQLVSKPQLLPYGLSRSAKVEDVLTDIENKLFAFCKKRSKTEHIAKDIQEIRNLVKREFRRSYDNKPEVVLNFIEME
ncbi:MAG: ribonuclease J [Proteobacteria bacterium]|nr:ribonuclease J [Pseudomonadota bacterium]